MTFMLTLHTNLNYIFSQFLIKIVSIILKSVDKQACNITIIYIELIFHYWNGHKKIQHIG